MMSARLVCVSPSRCRRQPPKPSAARLTSMMSEGAHRSWIMDQATRRCLTDLMLLCSVLAISALPETCQARGARAASGAAHARATE